MTDTTQAFAASPRLERPTEGGFKGVCAALARTTGTDLVLWRVLFVVLVFFGGLGLVLYVAGMIAIPEEGQDRSIGDRLLHGPDRHLQRNQALLVAVLVVLTALLLHDHNGFLISLTAVGLGYVWWRTGHEIAPRPAAPAVAHDALGENPVTFDAPSPPQSWPPRPPVRRSPLTGVTLSLALLVAGALVLIGVSGHSVPAEVVLASALATVGLGLVIGSFLGRSTGLVVVALLLGLGLAGTAAARPAIDHGVGDRAWNPSSSGSYRLGVGDATLDLSDLSVTEAQTYRIDARVDVGHLEVLVPEGVRVSVDARAAIGNVVVFGEESDGRDVHRTVEPDGRPQVVLDLSVRTGQIEVRRG